MTALPSAQMWRLDFLRSALEDLFWSRLETNYLSEISRYVAGSDVRLFQLPPLLTAQPHMRLAKALQDIKGVQLNTACSPHFSGYIFVRGTVEDRRYKRCQACSPVELEVWREDEFSRMIHRPPHQAQHQDLQPAALQQVNLVR